MKHFLKYLVALLTGTSIGAAEVPYDAPKISGINQNNEEINLTDLFATGYTIVYFYPKADTPGCTKQGCSLRDSWVELTTKNVKVIGVSGDTPEKQNAFQKKFQFPFPLMSDPKGNIMEAFGVPHTLSIAKRQAFLIKDGKVVWKDEDASTTDQATDILKAIAALEAL